MTSGALAALVLTAFAAGTVDAIAGGGGLLTLPALLLAGLPPGAALATNQGQAVFGSGSALLHFARAGAVDRERAPGAFLLGALGALGGAALVLAVPREVLRPLVLGLLVLVALALALKPSLGVSPGPALAPEEARPRALALALAVGAYDGFFGPGTGTFLILGAVAWLREPMTRASANAKVVNFASNLAALALFASAGAVRWELALPMAAAQTLGGALGARLAVRRGDRFVRGVVLVVVLALVVRLGWDLLRGIIPR
ncbi:MAG: TSUP family transporter [Deltaproteobacteria bacterium]|nr:TSUP family transporter [Deltaproteobacteria bacterium]